MYEAEGNERGFVIIIRYHPLRENDAFIMYIRRHLIHSCPPINNSQNHRRATFAYCRKGYQRAVASAVGITSGEVQPIG